MSIQDFPYCIELAQEIIRFCFLPIISYEKPKHFELIRTFLTVLFVRLSEMWYTVLFFIPYLKN